MNAFLMCLKNKRNVLPANEGEPNITGSVCPKALNFLPQGEGIKGFWTDCVNRI